VDGSTTEVSFHLDPCSDDILVVHKGPVTGSGYTEVHVLDAKTNYQTFKVHSATPIEPSAGLGAAEWTFGVKANGDLVGIKKGPTGTGKTEVHVLSKSSAYTSFVLQAPTALQDTSFSADGIEWDFAVLAKHSDDLMVIKKGPHTGSSQTEVHILSAAANYNNFTVNAPTALGYTDSSIGADWSFLA